MELKQKYRTLFANYYINTPLRVAHFMAQIHHESNLKPVSENLNYSKEALLITFKKYFKDDLKLPCSKEQCDAYNKDLRKKASDYARKPEKIANYVYANRMGNGNEASGDGWRYRGRGFIQISGKDNHVLLTKDTKIDFLKNPDLLLVEANSMISALWYWNKHKINALADAHNKDTVGKITAVINGGYNGLAHRTQLFNQYYKK